MQLLLIESERDCAKLLAQRLAECGFRPRRAASVEQAMREGLTEGAAALVLDLAGPAQSSAALVRGLRARKVDQPLLILSGQADWRERVECLDAGADEYLIKPVHSQEVAARLRAVIRRSAGASTDRIRIGDVELDLRARCAWRAGACLALTRSEFRLLRLLMLQPERTLKPQEILTAITDATKALTANAVEVQIARLRRKVGAARIVTMRGVGYRFSRHEAPDDDGGAKAEPEPCMAGRCSDI